MSKNSKYVIGIDYGTDSVRSILVNAENGEIIESSVSYYPRWKKGAYCLPNQQQFRQHPQDYLDSLDESLSNLLESIDPQIKSSVKGISVDTTGSTPVAVDKQGTPLSMTKEFEENPNGMFVLWKDHTGIQEAEEINQLASSWGGEDFRKYVGGIYSSEWFWAKILHVMREDKAVAKAAYSWVEHCDWITAHLTGDCDPLKMKRSRCAAGHKAMWHPEFEGLPSEEFLVKLDPILKGLRERLFSDTFPSDIPAGNLSEEWAKKLGLSQEVVIGVGAFDAHMGAIGAEIKPYSLVKIIGTSTCDILMAPPNEIQNKVIPGICGQVEGSVFPEMIGLEAGQSAFGDLYAWFKDVLLWPVVNGLDGIEGMSSQQKEKMIENVSENLLRDLSDSAEQIEILESKVVAMDWINGRRTPNANQTLKGAITNLSLGTSAPQIFKSLVEATAFGAKKIVDHFEQNDIQVKEVVACGGISQKSPYVMQVLSDVLNRPVKVSSSDQTCALGTAIAASVAAGLFKNMDEAQKAMSSGFIKTYQPIEKRVDQFKVLYQKYLSLGSFIENETAKVSQLESSGKSTVGSSYKSLKEECFENNLQLVKKGLVFHTFGNVSAADRNKAIFAIKPSGVSYETMKPEDMVIVDYDYNVVEGKLRPSSDTKTHAVLYRSFDDINGIVHTHSPFAVAWAQAKRSVPIYGTTHADHLTIDIPCTKVMSDTQIKGDYEEETGNLIVETFAELSPNEVEMILVACHGPFTWGDSAKKAVFNSALLEELARMAFYTANLTLSDTVMKASLIEKHYQRKHGDDAYYGQNGLEVKS